MKIKSCRYVVVPDEWPGLLNLDTVKWKKYVVSVNDAAVWIRLVLQGVSKVMTPCSTININKHLEKLEQFISEESSPWI